MSYLFNPDMIHALPHLGPTLFAGLNSKSHGTPVVKAKLNLGVQLGFILSSTHVSSYG